MVIDIHAHIIHKKMWSEKFWDFFVDVFSREKDISKEMVIEKFMPKIWGCNAEEFIAQMNVAGIDKALVMGVDWGMNSDIGEGKWSIEEANEWIAKQINNFSDKLFALCAIDPRRGKRAIKLLEKCVVKWGMKGLKLHPNAGFYPDDPKYIPLYEKCVELDVPLYSHTALKNNGSMLSEFADPVHLDTLATKIPNLKIVLVHFGGFSYNLKCVEIMVSRPNVYAEFSAHQTLAVTMPEYFLKNLRSNLDRSTLVGPPLKDKIMFGSDYPFSGFLIDQKAWVDWIKNIPKKGKEYGLKFKQREIKKILSLNAEKLLKL